MYQTKGVINVYVLGTGERVEMQSHCVKLWSKENDPRYDLKESDKKRDYDFTCARITKNAFWDTLTQEQQVQVISDRMNVFKFAERINITKPELVILIHPDDKFGDHPMHGWVSLDDLELLP